MNPDDLLKAFLHSLNSGIAPRDATQVAMPRPTGNPLAGLLLPQRSIGAAPQQPGLPEVGTSPHDLAGMVQRDAHGLIRGLIPGVGTAEDKLADMRGGVTNTAPAPLSPAELAALPVDRQLEYTNAQYAGGDPMLAAIVPGGRKGKAVDDLASDGVHYFDHYSPRGDLTELNPKFMGTGLAGAEKKRPDRVPMMHVYTSGATPEPMFRGKGMFKYSVPVNGRIYDVAADPAGIAQKAMKRGGPDAMERALQKAGYAGYHNGEYYPETVKLFGTQPVTPGVVPRTFGVLTAENPRGEQAGADANAAYNAALEKDLKKMGLKFSRVKGYYPDGNSGQHLHENSYAVPDMTRAQAVKLGKKYGQNSVITNEGMHDLTTGTTAPMTGSKYVEGGPFYTQFPGNRKVAFDFGEAPAGAVADSSASLIGSMSLDEMRAVLKQRRAALDGSGLAPRIPKPEFDQTIPKPSRSALPDSVASTAAQKVIGYHGTPHEFDQFKIGQTGYNSDLFGPMPVHRAAGFFAEDPKLAEEYARALAQRLPDGRMNFGRVRKAELTMNNPLDMQQGLSPEVLDKMKQVPDLQPIAQQLMQHPEFPPGQLWQLFDKPRGDDFVKILKDMGYDGAKLTEQAIDPTDNAKNRTSLAVFSDAQIKMLNSLIGAFSAGGAGALVHQRHQARQQ